MDESAHLLVEQATIGALMLQPDAVGTVEPWLRRSDFSQSWLGDLYVVLRERHRAGQACDAHSVGLAVAADDRSPRVPLPRLQDVLQATPVAPKTLAYARLVLESGLRREVDGLGSRPTCWAMAAAREGNQGPLQRTSVELVGLLRDANARWARSSDATGEAASTQLDDGGRVIDLRLGADRYLRAGPCPADRECVERERRLVGALLVRPAAAGAIGKTLQPEWFLARQWAAGFAAVLDLTASGDSVDVVTVACRVQELAATFGDVPTPQEALAAAEESLTDARVRAASAVSADLTVRTADSAAASLAGRAPTRSACPHLLDTARTLVVATLTAAEGMQPAGRRLAGTRP